MYDSVEISQGDRARGKWLILIHHIPPKPDYFRVKVRRRLHRIGAVALKNSVYVLPYTDEALEDFQWLRRMVTDEGGEATVCAASFVDGLSDGEVESMFRDQSDAEYDEIIDAALGIADPTDADVQRLQRQLSRAANREHFHSGRAEEARGAVSRLAARHSRDSESAGDTASSADTPRGATWVTRSGVFVDRMASAWLIRQFIDEEAVFKYVAQQGYTPEPGELRFDMFDGEFTHQGEDCTFEVLVKRFAPDDAALQAIAQIVHDVDCKDEKFGRDETAGVASLIRGVAAAHDRDDQRVAAAAVLFDGLYAALQRTGE